MFKKTLLSAIIISSLTQGALAATIYEQDGNSLALGGRLQINADSATVSESEKAAVQGYGRLNIYGQSRISEDFLAAAFAEWEVATESGQGDRFKTRFAYIAIESDTFGFLHLGQDHTSMYNVISATDVFKDIRFCLGGTTFWDLGGRQEGQVIYKYSDDNFYLGGSYQTSGLSNVDSGFALTAGLKFDTYYPVGINVGYDYYDFTKANNAQQVVNSDPALSPVTFSNLNSLYSVASSVSIGTLGDGFYAGATYQYTEKEIRNELYSYENGWKIDYAGNKSSHLHILETAGGYTDEAGWGFLVGYSLRRSNGTSKLSNINIQLAYQLTANFVIFTNAIAAVSPSETAGGYQRANDKITFSGQYNF